MINHLKNYKEIQTPALIFFPKIIRRNIEAMIQIAGDPNRLWPHIKTHKSKEIIRIQQEYGIHKFKCATLHEAKILAEENAKEILVAFQLHGQNLNHYLTLTEAFPNSKFYTLIDHMDTLKAMESYQKEIHVWIDLNIGMNRTGIVPEENAFDLFKALKKSPFLQFSGLHAYDGHIRENNYQERNLKCDASFKKVLDFKEKLDLPTKIIAGGSPTFPYHASRKDVFLSPGTIPLWDYGYSTLWSESPFTPAAFLATRVVSKPQPDLLCLDIGHKAVAAEMPFPRVKILELEDTATQISQSEEHLVVKSSQADQFKPGDMLTAIPIHICPTVARYNKVYIADEESIKGMWNIQAQSYFY
jgi:D-serine deaminase-like pyridoxal phosphate-dependent protein